MSDEQAQDRTRFPCTRRSIVDHVSRETTFHPRFPPVFSYRKPDARVGRAPRRLENSNTLFLCRPAAIPSSPLSRSNNHHVSFLPRWSMLLSEPSCQRVHLPAAERVETRKPKVRREAEPKVEGSRNCHSVTGRSEKEGRRKEKR